MKVVITSKFGRLFSKGSRSAPTGAAVSPAVVATRREPVLFLGWIQRILITSGIVMLGYCGFVLVDAWHFENRESRQIERLSSAHLARAMRSQNASSKSSIETLPVSAGGLIGRIQIQRLGLSAILLEGTTNKTLRRAVGHIAGTALPGEPGNIGIAGHRDRFFRPLRNVQTNDLITLTTPANVYTYRVVSAKVVGPSDVAVLDSDGSEILTLVTCYPFYFVGSAPDRFIVRAQRIKGQT